MERSKTSQYLSITRETELHLAIRKHRHYSTISLLCHVFSTNVQNRNLETPLHVAAKYNDPYIARLLLEFGSSTSAKDRNGETPLHIAAKHNYRKVVEVLLQFKSSHIAKNKRGFTPLRLAKRYGHKGIQVLIKRGNSQKSSPFRNSNETIAKEHRVNKAGNIMNKGFSEYTIHIVASLANVSMKKIEIRECSYLKGKEGNLLPIDSASEKHVENCNCGFYSGPSHTLLHCDTNGKFEFKNENVVQMIIDSEVEKGLRANIVRKFTALHFAVAFGYKDVVEMLLNLHANTDVNLNKRYDMVTPFHFAVQQCDPEICTMFLDSGTDMKSVDCFGQSVLHYAVACGNKPVVEMLLEHGNDVNIKGYNDATLLHLAAGGKSYGHFEVLIVAKTDENCRDIVSLLLDRSADINAKDGLGRTALHYAAAGGHAEIIQLLIEYGALWCARSISYDLENIPFSETILHSAAKHNRLKVIECFLEKFDNLSQNMEHAETDPVPLYYKNGNVRLENQLYPKNEAECGLSITEIYNMLNMSTSKANMTPLLLKKSISQHLTDLPPSGGSPLHMLGDMLSERRNSETTLSEQLQALLDSGEFNINGLDFTANTPLHSLIVYLHRTQYLLHSQITLNALQLLLDNKANINARNRDGETALMLAIEGGFSDLFVNLIVKSEEQTGISVKLDTQNLRGETALIIAAKRRNKEVVRLLLNRGASVTLQDHRGFTPLHAAIYPSDYVCQNLEIRYVILKLLLDACPSAVNAVDLCGNTILDLAKKYESTITENMLGILMEYSGVFC